MVDNLKYLDRELNLKHHRSSREKDRTSVKNVDSDVSNERDREKVKREKGRRDSGKREKEKSKRKERKEKYWEEGVDIRRVVTNDPVSEENSKDSAALDAEIENDYGEIFSRKEKKTPLFPNLLPIKLKQEVKGKESDRGLLITVQGDSENRSVAEKNDENKRKERSRDRGEKSKGRSDSKEKIKSQKGLDSEQSGSREKSKSQKSTDSDYYEVSQKEERTEREHKRSKKSKHKKGRDRSRSRSRERRVRSRSRSLERRRSRSRSLDRRRSRSRSLERRKSRSWSRERRMRSRSRSRERRDRSRSREKRKSSKHERNRSRSKSREERRSRSREKKRSRRDRSKEKSSKSSRSPSRRKEKERQDQIVNELFPGPGAKRPRREKVSKSEIKKTKFVNSDTEPIVILSDEEDGNRFNSRTDRGVIDYNHESPVKERRGDSLIQLTRDEETENRIEPIITMRLSDRKDPSESARDRRESKENRVLSFVPPLPEEDAIPVEPPPIPPPMLPGLDEEGPPPEFEVRPPLGLEARIEQMMPPIRIESRPHPALIEIRPPSGLVEVRPPHGLGEIRPSGLVEIRPPMSMGEIRPPLPTLMTRQEEPVIEKEYDPAFPTDDMEECSPTEEQHPIFMEGTQGPPPGLGLPFNPAVHQENLVLQRLSPPPHLTQGGLPLQRMSPATPSHLQVGQSTGRA